jgi:putative oxidoreductase
MSVPKTLSRCCERIAVAALPIVPLVTRLVLGQAFFLTGLGKWRHFENTVEFFSSAGLPAPTLNAAIAATVELLGGACLVLGLGTRLAAGLLSGTMVVALMTADRGSFLAALGQGGSGLTDVTAFVFLLFLVWLFTVGSGWLSADRFLFQKQHPQRQTLQPVQTATATAN